MTLHLPLTWFSPEALAPQRPNTYLHCVSEAQHRTAPPSIALLPPITNGVDLETFRPRGGNRDFAMLSAGSVQRGVSTSPCTPVIAFDAGAFPEIVEDGETGFIVKDEGGLVHAIREVDQFSPDRCRAAATARFGLDRTIGSYFAAYRELVRQSTLNTSSTDKPR